MGIPASAGMTSGGGRNDTKYVMGFLPCAENDNKGAGMMR
jgi:hypothetical protein